MRDIYLFFVLAVLKTTKFLTKIYMNPLSLLYSKIKLCKAKILVAKNID